MLKVLLVDDEFHVINHISELLKNIDFCELNILQTTSGPDALQIVAASHIDIAFLDINMPRISGLQIANKLHRQWPDCQIVFLTAYEVFDYIYDANKYPNAVYLLKSEPDAKILEIAANCCRSVLQKHEQKIWLNEFQKKEKLLLLLQEQHLLREILHGNLTENWETFVKEASLDIQFSFHREIYLMLMHIKQAPFSYSDTAFYLEKMEHLVGNLFHFSFVEAEKGIFLWVFQERDSPDQEISSFSCLKDTMDSFLDIYNNHQNQALCLCMLQEQTTWEHLARSYQFLYDAYYKNITLLPAHVSAARVVQKEPSDTEVTVQKETVPASLSFRLSSMKQALYQGNRDAFLTDLHYCRQYGTSIRSMHHTGAIKLYFSVVLIYLDYIEHYKLEPRLSMEIALYPLYYINDFQNWEKAYEYLQQLGTLLFRIANENNNDRTKQLIASIQNYIQTHLSDDLNLTVIANYANYNESHISRLFKRHTGSNLSEYITACRIDLARSLLVQTEDTIHVISRKSGFHTSQYFSSTFRKITGLSPQEYRVKNKKDLNF